MKFVKFLFFSVHAYANGVHVFLARVLRVRVDLPFILTKISQEDEICQFSSILHMHV